MRVALSGADRRALLLGFVVIGSLWTLLRGAPRLIRSTAEAREDVRVLRASVARYEQLRAVMLGTRTDTAGVADDMVFSASSSGALASALASSLSDVANSSGVSLSALRADLPDSVGTGLSRVAAIVNGDCDVEGCATLLASLEEHRPSVRVSRLRLVAGDVIGSSLTAQRLQFEMLVEALGRLVKQP